MAEAAISKLNLALDILLKNDDIRKGLDGHLLKLNRSSPYLSKMGQAGANVSVWRRA